MSQCDRIAALLADGEWWTTRDLLREVPSIVHSRIAELRARGYEIEHERVGPGAAGSRYRLVRAIQIDAPSVDGSLLGLRSIVRTGRSAGFASTVPAASRSNPPQAAGTQLSLDAA